MERRDRSDCSEFSRVAISRRAALGAVGLAILGLLACSSLGQGLGREEHDAAIKARLEQRKAFGERMRNTGSREERIKMMAEVRAMDRQRAIGEFKSKLGLSDEEWTVLKPRIEAVYNLMYPQAAMGIGSDLKGPEVEQRRGELREVLDNAGSDAGQIKTRLDALRAAKEKADRELVRARQDLRRLMTLRREAELVLCGLLD